MLLTSSTQCIGDLGPRNCFLNPVLVFLEPSTITSFMTKNVKVKFRVFFVFFS